MRRTLKLLLLLGIGLALAGKKPDSPSGTPGEFDDVDIPPKFKGLQGNSTPENHADIDAKLDKGEVASGSNEGPDNEPGESDSSPDGQQATAPSHPNKWADNNLETHFDAHRSDPNAEWDSTSEYQYAAMDLMDIEDGWRPGLRIKVTGDTAYYYDPATGEFGRSGPRGIITFFIPHPDPNAYFERQPGTEVYE